MKQSSRSRFEEKLAKEHACYILITCDRPSPDGQMNVEMSHGGDIALASYLLQGAQSVMDQHIDDDRRANDPELRIVK